MKLLNGHSLAGAQVIPIVNMSLQLKERESTATITPQDMTGITVGSWLMDDRAPGDGIVWRVRSIQQAYATKTPTAQLEHVISTLKDQIMFGEVTPADMAGDPSATTCTARQAVEFILDRQSDWALGSIDYDVSNPYKFDGETLFEALETVTNSLEDAQWTYDTTVYPFLLNIVQRSTDVESELRAGRNMKTISRSVDKSGMYTRFYPIGKDDLHIPGEYVERNVSQYGVISKVETDQSLDTVDELTRWANERLKMHAQPTVTITVEGLELSRATGEKLDRLAVGRVCRVPLPEFNTTIQERIVEISYPDKINQPEVVKVTLANSRQDVTKIISDALKKSGKSGRGAAKKDKQDLAWFEDTNDHVSMTAIGIIGVDAQGNPNWTRMSEFIADGEGLHAKVETQIGDATDRIATLEFNEEELRTEISDGLGEVRSSITETASNIRMEVSRRARVFVQINDPRSEHIDLHEGDIWVKAARVQSWNDLTNKSWADASQLDWNEYAGSRQFVWDSVNNRWEPIGDKGAMVEWGTRIDQTEKNITLLAHAIGQIDATAMASIDISADAITLAVSSAKSELYSVIKQTSTNIVHEVVNDIDGVSSYVEQTASSLNEAIAKKNRVFVQMTDPVNNTGVTLRDGDIWIKSVGNDNIKPTWSELSAKTWASQSTTNWRDYYSGAWYVRKNDTWELMREDADVVEIGTMIERDEEHLALVARTVDENHQELGARLNVTAREIRGEVHAAKSTLYSVISQTATQIRAVVADVEAGLSSSITQNANSIALVVEGDEIKPAAIVAAINDGASSVVISANHINLDGYVKATDITSTYIKTKISDIDQVTVKSLLCQGAMTFGQGGSISIPGANVTFSSGSSPNISTVKPTSFIKAVRINGPTNNEYKLQYKTAFASSEAEQGWTDAGTFSRATSLSGAWSSNTYTVTASPQGNTNSVTPVIDLNVPTSGQPSSSTSIYVATSTSSGYSRHGDGVQLKLVDSDLTVKLQNANNQTIIQKTLSLSGASITFDCTDQGDPSTDKNDLPITATAKKGSATIASADQIIHMTQGGWSSGKKAVNVRLTNNSGKLVTRLWVEMPGSASSFTLSNTALHYATASITIGGKTYSKSFNYSWINGN